MSIKKRLERLESAIPKPLAEEEEHARRVWIRESIEELKRCNPAPPPSEPAAPPPVVE